MNNNKVKKVWNVSPQRMLEYCIATDKENKIPDPSFYYVGKPLSYVRQVYEEYVGLESLTDEEQIQNGYYTLELTNTINE